MPGVSREPPKGQTELDTIWSVDAGDYAVAMVVAHDGSRVGVATGADEVRVLDAATGEERWRQRGHGGGVLALALSPDGKRLAAGGHDGRVHVSEVATGQKIHTLEVGKAWVEHVAWSPDGRALAAAAGRAVRLWTAQGQPLLEAPAHASTVTGLQWSHRGSRLATCCYGGASIWPLKEGVQAQHLPWKGSLVSLAWSPDEKVVACGPQDGSVHFWRLLTRRDSEMSGYPSKPRVLAWDGGSTLLATSGDATICVWDFRGKGPEGTRPIQLQGHRAGCSALAFSPSRTLLASGGQDSGVIVWDPRRGHRPLRYAFLEDEVTAVRWGARGEALFGADARGTVRRWRVAL